MVEDVLYNKNWDIWSCDEYVWVSLKLLVVVFKDDIAVCLIVLLILVYFIFKAPNVQNEL